MACGDHSHHTLFYATLLEIAVDLKPFEWVLDKQSQLLLVRVGKRSFVCLFKVSWAGSTRAKTFVRQNWMMINHSTIT